MNPSNPVMNAPYAPIPPHVRDAMPKCCTPEQLQDWWNAHMAYCRTHAAKAIVRNLRSPEQAVEEFCGDCDRGSAHRAAAVRAGTCRVITLPGSLSEDKAAPYDYEPEPGRKVFRLCPA